MQFEMNEKALFSMSDQISSAKRIKSFEKTHEDSNSHAAWFFIIIPEAINSEA